MADVPDPANQEIVPASAAASPAASPAAAAAEAVDVGALLAIGVKLSKLEELYGKETVREAAAALVKSGNPKRLQVGVLLLDRSASMKTKMLRDDAFVESLLASLEEDPEDMLMDPLLMVPLKDPVVLSSGFVVDRATAIDEHGNLRLRQCPFSREYLREEVYPLVFLRDRVKAWKLERLGKALSVAEDLMEQGSTEEAEQVFTIAERFLDEVGDTTYIQMARRLAEVERRAPSTANDPARLLRIHRRSLRVLQDEGQRQQLVREALEEFLAGARRALESNDCGEAAAPWLSEDLSKWLREPDVKPLWADQLHAWQLAMLQLEKARGREESTWQWRRDIFQRLKGAGSEAALAAWLQEEALSGEEPQLQAVFDVESWEVMGADWDDARIGLLDVQPGRVWAEYRHSLSPEPGTEWFLELVFTVYSLDERPYMNTIFSQHGPGTGWEVRVCQVQGIELVWTTNDNGHHNHNERFTGLGADCISSWTHVVVAVVAGPAVEIRVFVNGQAATPYRLGATFAPANELPCLGRNPYWTDRCIDGKVAHARVEQRLPVHAAELQPYVTQLAERRLSQMPSRDRLAIEVEP